MKTLIGAVLGVSLALLLPSCLIEDAKTGPQNWSPEDRHDWYRAMQGSRIMPMAWFRALERAGSTEPFFDQAWVDSQFRTLGYASEGSNALPIGFVADEQDDTDLGYSKLHWFEGQSKREQWVGLNCSACHTGELRYGGSVIRIDGAPSLFDFQRFVEAMDLALAETRDDPEKFARFAARVLSERNSSVNRDLLKGSLDNLLEWQARTDFMNETPLRYGFGRTDAFGHIFNKVAMFVGREKATANPSDAPVNYPQLWGIHRHDKLQWNGIAKSDRVKVAGKHIDVGALGRNAGQVLGVFGDVVPRPSPGLGGFKSSVDAKTLMRFEKQLERLAAPRWPSAFPPIDAEAAKRGQEVFVRSNCAECHRQASGDGMIEISMTPILHESTPEIERTDPRMACNAFTYETASGPLEGAESVLENGEKIGSRAQTAELTAATVRSVLLAKKLDIGVEAGYTFVGVHRRPRVVEPSIAYMSASERKQKLKAQKSARLLQCAENSDHQLLAYKARSLEGIWATAPYLHNGSVPTLYDLFRPASNRPAKFRLGTREFDPVKVGFKTDINAPGNDFVFDAADPEGGNANAGHEYGAGALTDTDRYDLIEYLKTL